MQTIPIATKAKISRKAAKLFKKKFLRKLKKIELRELTKKIKNEL